MKEPCETATLATAVGKNVQLLKVSKTIRLRELTNNQSVICKVTLNLYLQLHYTGCATCTCVTGETKELYNYSLVTDIIIARSLQDN